MQEIGEYKRRVNWQPSQLKSNNHATLYTIRIATLDRLLTDEERESHGVRSHERQLANGKVVPVKSHERRNPRLIRSRRTNTTSFDHVVYRALDADGVLRYFGEGTSSRPSHVNSGVSHNYKLNEHYFRRGPMTVEVIREGLTKQEGQAIELLLLREHRHHELWNKKDFEPLVDHSAADATTSK